MESLLLLLVLFLLVLFAGGICGVIAVVKSSGNASKLKEVEKQLSKIRSELQHISPGKIPASIPEKQKETHAPVTTAQPAPAVTGQQVRKPEGSGKQVFEKPAVPEQPLQVSKEKVPAKPVPSPAGPKISLEMKLGSRWIVWAGVIFLLIATGFFIRYAYNNNWIGPLGRIAIGVVAGMISMGLGEYFRRKDWNVLFQSLTGCGIGILYICVFAAFHFYQLTGQGTAFILTIFITLFSIAMAVVHNAVSIAVLGILGGFLSPVILSTGENHPYILFSYIAILNLIAMGSAIFRRWRGLDFLALAGTGIIYAGWYEKFYDTTQMTPALLYISVFYLMFLVIPMLNSLVRRLPEKIDGVILVVLNALLSFLVYYAVLFETHRYILGFVVLIQAFLVFLLFQAWVRRVGRDARTAETLLIITLGLVTIAIPIHLKMYGIPIAWAIESVVVLYLGIRFKSIICRISGIAVLLCAAISLFRYLPLHSEVFTPVFNRPFGSWLVVIAAASAAAWLLYRARDMMDCLVSSIISALLVFGLLCLLLSFETAQFWTVIYGETLKYHVSYMFDSLVVLWSIIPLGTILVFRRAGIKKQVVYFLPLVCYGIGVVLFLIKLGNYRIPGSWFGLNWSFATQLVFVISLWTGSLLLRDLLTYKQPVIVACIGHILMVILLAAESVRWSGYCSWLSQRMGISLISALWAVQACILIWVGLITRTRLRRILGFGIFAICVGKTLIYDMSTLQEVYRIVSFLVSGVLLITAGYFYHSYSHLLLAPEEQTPEEQE